ncbi:MAG: patatin-like phospholipase family protein, partial [Candidatus Binataceae bacterium]
AIKVFPVSRTNKKFIDATDAVALAVAASISIPFFFRPLRLGVMELVDGGLLSNFPAWVFDEERQVAGPFTPTYGFKLVKRPHPANSPSRWEFVRRLVAVTLAGDEVLETRQIEEMYIVPLFVTVGTLDFNLSQAQKDNLYLEGRDGARSFFLKEVPREQTVMVTALQTAHAAMLGVLGRANIHLRVNIALETTRTRLRIAYSFNMDNDADDRLEFDAGGGACGLCWKIHDLVICDLEDAKKTFATNWKMNKYQQAAVRQSLRSLLSVPIFDRKKYDGNRPDIENPLVAVLSFDSDDELLGEFSKQSVRMQAKNASALLATLLRP